MKFRDIPANHTIIVLESESLVMPTDEALLFFVQSGLLVETKKHLVTEQENGWCGLRLLADGADIYYGEIAATIRELKQLEPDWEIVRTINPNTLF